MKSTQFIRRGTQPNRYDNFVSAPLFRKTFTLDCLPERAVFSIGTPGFYRLYVNGQDITKGPLAPYISNPDHILYYDTYDISPLLKTGRNALVILAGNGNGSSPGGSVWSFEKFPWTDAAKIAFELDLDGEITEADETVKCCDSAIYFDDLRSGERCDGRLYNPDFFTADYDDSGWDNAIGAKSPEGIRRESESHPIFYTGNDYEGVFIGEYKVSENYHPHRLSFGDPAVTVQEDIMRGSAPVYDFGINTTGMPVFTVSGKAGQRLEFQFAEYIDKDNELSFNNINFFPEGYAQRDVYICRGEEGETYAPQFTYHGARYVAVFGLDEETRKSFRVTFRQISSVKERFVDFRCSDKNAESLFNMCVNSDLSNLVYFPTDCPHREKNGWTGDAANSAERMSMFYDLYDDYREWMHNIRKAQRENGEIPVIIPTDTWGYEGINPSWDKVIAFVPWYAYLFTGRKEILTENCEAVFSYIKHLDNTLDSEWLFPRDIGDWLCVDNHKKTSFRVTASASACATCDYAEKIFSVLGRDDYIAFTKTVKKKIVAGIRAHFINRINGICDNATQSSQSIAIKHGFFTEAELPLAKQRLMEAIRNEDDHFCFGLQSATTLFPVLIEMGEAELVWKMIMREDFPSYAHFIKQGLTAMPENFYCDDESNINSLNHHMFGIVALYFTKYFAGLEVLSPDTIRIAPHCVKALSFAEARYMSEKGEIIFRWERNADGTITNHLTVPEGITVMVADESIKMITERTGNKDGDRKGYRLFHEAWCRR